MFKLTPPATSGGAWTESVLYSFTGGSDGGVPFAGLIADASGALYGTTAGGGNTSCTDGCGTVFKLAPPATQGGAWTETVLHSFTGADGSGPLSGLVADANGNLFGTTSGGGTSGLGTVFEVAGSGFVPPTRFAGIPGTANCIGMSISTLAHTYGGIAHAAEGLGYASVKDLQEAVTSYCGGVEGVCPPFRDVTVSAI